MTRPLKYKTVEELEAAIKEYFNSRQLQVMPPTIAGLALLLVFEDRQSIYDYKDRPAFSCTIKKAITAMEDYAEQRLLVGEGSSTGAIFWLKNHGWKDKTETDINVQNYSLCEDDVERKAKKYVKTNKRGKKKVKK